MLGSPLPATARRQRLGVVALLGAGALLAPVATASTASATPSPPATVPAATFTPVQGPGTALGASAVDLAEFGYVEQEYFASGEANRYRGAQPGALSTAEVIDGGHQYQTRLLVRTPEDPRDFNGTVVVEWSNVTVGQDVDFAWAESHEYLLRQGYAFVGLTVQKVGADALTRWDPERYAGVSVDADNTDPATGQPIDDRSDVLAWDVFSQVGQGLVEPGSGDRPLAGLDVERLIGMGESQSAGRLTTYYNTIQPMHHVYDGFVYYDRAGQLRGDLTTPAVSVDTEWSSSRPTSAIWQPSPYVRSWEVAGTSHVSLEGVEYVDAQLVRDQSLVVGGVPVSLTGAIQGCTDYPLFSTVDTGLVVDAAIHHVDRWIATGTPAPDNARFQRGADGLPVRDASGNVVGGVRLSDFTVPFAVNRSINTGPGFCTLAGSHRLFTAEELAALYRNHGAYVSQVRQSLNELVRAGYVLPDDAREVRREATASTVGT